LLKVREGNYNREYGGARVDSGGREHTSLLQVLLKFMVIYGKGGIR
jgi:hypothetical protein